MPRPSGRATVRTGEEQATAPDDRRTPPGTNAETDPIGTASARLLAAGVDRAQRSDALAYLGLLLDHADASGWVRIRTDVLAAEFAIEPDDADRRMAHLQRVAAVTPVDGGWRIASFEGYRPAGLRASDAMALIAEAIGRPLDTIDLDDVQGTHDDVVLDLDLDPDDEPVTDLVPVPRSSAPTVPLLTAAPSPGPRRPRRPRQVVELLAAVAAVLALVVGVVAAWPDTPDRLAATASGTAPTAAPGPEATEGEPGLTPPEPGAGPATPAPTPVTPADQPVATLPGGPSAGPGAAVTCPSGGPSVRVDEVRLASGAHPVVAVDGTLTNAASATVADTTIEVTASQSGTPLGTVVTTVADPVAAGAVVTWQVVLGGPTTDPSGAAPVVTATVAGWSWADPAMVACSG